MKTQMAHVVSLLAFATIGLTATAASAQRVYVEEEGGGGARFRGGIDLTGGGVFLGNTSVGVVGLDGRLGVQVNNLLGLYIQPHLVFGGGTYLGTSGFDGVFAVDGLADFTFDRLFFGAGAGLAYTGVNNFYASPEAHLRVGFYPLVGHTRRGRRGLMIGADLRIIYWTIPGDGTPLLEPTIAIGYEAF